jgi:hypothetical protein
MRYETKEILAYCLIVAVMMLGPALTCWLLSLAGLI